MISWFPSVYDLISKHGTLLSYARAESLVREALACSELQGDFWECGVYRGGSARLLAEVIKRIDWRRLVLFDTFTGLPEVGEMDQHKRGEFQSSQENVFTILDGFPAEIHAGRIPDSFLSDPCLSARKIAFAHLDLDLYSSTKDALAFIWPHLVKGGSILIDDYEWDDRSIGCPGVKLAIDESNLPVRKSVDFQAIITKA